MKRIVLMVLILLILLFAVGAGEIYQRSSSGTIGVVEVTDN